MQSPAPLATPRVATSLAVAAKPAPVASAGAAEVAIPSEPEQSAPTPAPCPFRVGLTAITKMPQLQLPRPDASMLYKRDLADQGSVTIEIGLNVAFNQDGNVSKVDDRIISLNQVQVKSLPPAFEEAIHQAAQATTYAIGVDNSCVIQTANWHATLDYRVDTDLWRVFH
jgi:hypothetical protein